MCRPMNRTLPYIGLPYVRTYEQDTALYRPTLCALRTSFASSSLCSFAAVRDSLSRSSFTSALCVHPQHYCYSTTTKTAWESYVVEKGCMRIKYCHDRQAARSEWSKPWNFCCKRSRCNAKLGTSRSYGTPTF